MRYKYRAKAFILARHSLGESNASVALATDEFGVIRARAQGLHVSRSKMAAGLQTLAQSDVMLIRGKDGWRLTGAILHTNWARELAPAARVRAGRIIELVRRLSHGEDAEPRLYSIMSAFTSALPSLSEEEGEAAEILSALRILHVLGHDAGMLPGELNGYESETLAYILEQRKNYIARVNKGIEASGL